MINLPDFSKCVEFIRLKEKMGVTHIPVLPIVKFTRNVTEEIEIEEPNTKAIQIEEKLIKGSIEVRLQDIVADEKGLLNVLGTKVVAYIRDQPRGIDYFNKYSKYRYHLCNCSTLNYMRKIGRERRYLCTEKKDELFEVHDISNDRPNYRPLKITIKMNLCQNCIRELKINNLWFAPFYT